MAKVTRTKQGLYTTVVYLGKENGKNVQKRLTASSKMELKRMVEEYKVMYREEAPMRKNYLSLEDAYNRYIDTRRSSLAPSTIKYYHKCMRTSFQGLMDKDINKITDSDVQLEINRLVRVNEPKTIKNKYGLFMSVMKKYAHRPPQEVFLPKRKKNEVYIPTKQEIETLLESVKGTKYEVPIMLGAFCGLRRGEVAALTWKDVDMKNRKIKINKAIGDSEQGYIVKSPKSYAGYREVDIPDRLYSVLCDRQSNDMPLIEISIHALTKRFPRVLERANLPKFRFHDLRHYFASVLLALGIPDLYVIKIIGHSTTDMLKRNYQHIMKDADDRYRKIISDNFNAD